MSSRRSNTGVTRRRLVQSAAIAGGATIGHHGLTAAQGTPAASPAVPASFQEAPVLTTRVDSGELPAVAERMPVTPKVVTPLEEVGQYGGSFRLAIQGPADAAWIVPYTNGYEHLMRWIPETINFTLDEVEPNVAESVDITDDGATYTFTLREGMKWSDGEPFTADDIMFWYNDVIMNEEITPAVPSWLTAGDQPVTVEKVDDLTVRFSFTEPNGLFLQNICTPSGRGPTASPEHYLRQFHKAYNENVVAQAEQEQFESWVDYFLQYASIFDNPELPNVFAWTLNEAVGDSTQQVVATRNPYYWKVDTEGNQLPYMDEVNYRVVAEKEVMILNALNGEIDLLSPAVPALRDKPLFFDGQEEGGFRIMDAVPAIMNTLVIALNLTNRDQAKREIFTNKDFRIGLSHAINRQEIIDAVFVSQGQPHQAAPRPESDLFYNEEFATQFTEYNVELANEHLDRVLPEKDSDGFRLGPNGERFFFTVEGAVDVEVEWADMLEMIRSYWQAVGIDVQVKAIERSLYYERVEGNQHEASFWAGGGGIDVILNTTWYIPSSTLGSLYGTPWAAWYLNPEGDAAIEPPEQVRQGIELYRQVSATVDPAEQADLMRQVLEIAADQFFGLGLVLPPNGFTIATNRMRNVPATVLDAWLCPSPAPSNPEQYFIAGETAE